MKIEPTLRFSPLLVPLLLVVLFSSCSSSPSETSVLWISNANRCNNFHNSLASYRRLDWPGTMCYIVVVNLYWYLLVTWRDHLHSEVYHRLILFLAGVHQSVHCHHTDHLLHHCLSLDSNLVTIYQSLTLISSTNEHLLTLLQPVIWGKQMMWP